MKITLLDNTVKDYKVPMSVKQIAADIAITLGKNCIGGIINNELMVRDDYIVSKDIKLEIITERHEVYQSVLANTAVAIAQTALKIENPKIKIADYEIKDTGEFSIIFDCEPRLNQESIDKLNARILEIISEKVDIESIIIDPNAEETKRRIKLNPYVKHHFEEIHKKYLPLWVYILRGIPILLPTVVLHNTSSIFKIEVQNVTGEYYKGDASQPMIQKIHCIFGANEKSFKELQNEIEERKLRDHRYIGKQLEIFTIDPIIGQGLPVWLPNGTILKQEIKKYLVEKEWEYDFIQIETPVIGTKQLYINSGHWNHYRDDMFTSMKLQNDEEVVLKPMSCPHHISVYNFKPRSYKELPLRFAEHAIQHRYESSGSLTGLERVRAMELTDSHIFARRDQIKDEFKRCYKLIEEVLKTFSIDIDYLSLSLRDPKDKEKYFNDDKMWNEAEEQLEDVLKELKISYKKMEGEAAFYGPKLDIQAKTVLGHEITVSTIQLDFLLPERFNLEYINENGSKEKPVMIHRGLIGTYERFISVLLEQKRGVLPFWCTPIQLTIIPVDLNNHMDYSIELQKIFKSKFIRTKIDDRDERLSYKIRDSQVKKIPYQLVVGDNEIKDKTITFREYGKDEQLTVKLDEFLKIIDKKLEKRES